MTNANINAIESQFIELVGQFAVMCAFNRSIGQLYGTLYMSPVPLSLEEAAHACGMSKGNASIHLRTLEQWGAVRQSGKPGNRRDFYSANTDLKGLAIKRLNEGIARRLEFADARIKSIKGDTALAEYLQKPEGAHCKARLEEIESLLQQVQNGFALLPKLFDLKRFLPL